MTLATKVPVRLGSNSYEILVGEGVVELAGQKVSDILGRRKIFLVTDENVSRLYEKHLRKVLEKAGHEVITIIVAAGEASKDFSSLEYVVEEMLRQHVTRGSVLIAFGGGVVGDLAGFAASIVMRGIEYIQIPTTLLSQVDSSVGGKTAINTKLGKNLVGSFYQPRLVLADTGFLKSLSRRELIAGYGEVAKYGLLGDATLFNWLEANGTGVLAAEAEACRHVVAACCENKADTVSNDEREHGARLLLNLGHTFAHALEADLNYDDRLLHGEAVAIGSIIALDTSVRLGFCDPAVPARVRRHFEMLGLPTCPPKINSHNWDPQRLLNHMARDKKSLHGQQILILVRTIGDAFVYKGATKESILQSWEECLNSE
jgi:3-dehydroquinate synthase